MGLIANSACKAGIKLPQLYLQTEGGRPAEMWDFSRASRPDAVIVYLGTNDYSCNTTTDAAFTAALVLFLRNITGYYARSPGVANTTFFIAIGPIVRRNGVGGAYANIRITPPTLRFTVLIITVVIII